MMSASKLRGGREEILVRGFQYERCNRRLRR